MPAVKRARPLQVFRRCRGAILVELMVGSVVGLIVIGAVLALMVNTLHASSTNVQYSQLAQALRSAMEIISRDLRRAGANPDLLSCYSQNQCNSSHKDVTYFASNGQIDCVIFSLDRGLNGVADSGDWAGIRYGSIPGAIEVKISGDAADDECSDGTWVALTDTDIVNVTAFSLDTSPSYSFLVSQDTSAGTQSLLQVRKVNVSITGELAAGGGSQTITETIRLRNDSFVSQAIPGP